MSRDAATHAATVKPALELLAGHGPEPTSESLLRCLVLMAHATILLLVELTGVVGSEKRCPGGNWAYFSTQR